jgi:flagellar basal-body rod protein FlgF/flagellar basal-body rod protein FlgG
MLESSNVNPASSLVDLITVQRRAEMMERAMAAFYSDLNHTAAGELARI